MMSVDCCFCFVGSHFTDSIPCRQRHRHAWQVLASINLSPSLFSLLWRFMCTQKFYTLKIRLISSMPFNFKIIIMAEGNKKINFSLVSYFAFVRKSMRRCSIRIRLENCIEAKAEKVERKTAEPPPSHIENHCKCDEDRPKPKKKKKHSNSSHVLQLYTISYPVCLIFRQNAIMHIWTPRRTKQSATATSVHVIIICICTFCGKQEFASCGK